MEKETLLKYFPNSKKAQALKKGKTHVSNEGAEQVRLIQWLNYQHPKLVWMFDLAGASEVIASKASDFRPRGFKMPDFQLFLPRAHYSGLFIELKRVDFSLYTLKGAMKKNEHIETQARSLGRLRDLGYWADFASGFDDARMRIEAYMDLKKHHVLKDKIILRL